MRKALVLAVVVAVLAAFAGTALAGWANPGLLATPQTVKANAAKADWVILDCRDLKDYVKGHIPGAISLGMPCKKALRDGTSRVFSNPSKYETILGKAGIGNDTHVVAYGDMKTKTMEDATVAFWVLEYLGHNKAHVLNGGMDAWLASGEKLVQQPTVKQPKAFRVKVDHSKIAATDEILQIAKGQKKGVQLIDARSKKEHAGEDIRAIRGGHVPNTTVNIPHDGTYDKKKDPKTGKDASTGVLSPDNVAKAYASLDKTKRTVGYCQTGTRSTTTYLELRLLGFKDPANWDESWTVWSNALNRGYPVADEEWIDLSRLKKLEDDMKKIKEKLEPAEAKK